MTLVNDQENTQSLVRLAGPQGQRPSVALVGNPNTGKTTLFNALTGLRQKVANVPGVTVDLKQGALPLPRRWVDLLDLPGLYALAPNSPDEEIAVEVLLGLEGSRPDAILAIVDGTHLERNLYLVSQLLELDLPVLLAVNMLDAARAQGIEIELSELANRLGVPVVGIVASSGRGLEELRAALDDLLDQEPETRHSAAPAPLPELRRAVEEELASSELPAVDQSGAPTSTVALARWTERAVIDIDGALESLYGDRVPGGTERVEDLRARFGDGGSLTEREAETRYARVDELLSGVLRRPTSGATEDRADRWLSHPVLGTAIFFGVMTLIFQAVFSWAGPIMDLIDGSTGAIGDLVRAQFPDGSLIASLLADGVIAGVGAVIVFLPQILILFAFILVLEDSGYLARAAFLMDRLMRLCGLSGQSFIPMMTSFACAIPGIMATRVIPNPRDRLATLLAAPFMTCSARLPVYTLLIAAFVPDRHVGPLNLQGLVLLGLYLLGLFGGVGTALLLKRTVLRGPTPTFLLEMPPYRRPDLRSIALRLMDRGRIFLTRAGTVIFLVTVAVWFLATFPRFDTTAFDQQRLATADAEQLAQIDRDAAAAQLEASFLGRAGRIVEPLFEPLGWDWRVSSAVIAAFPAREVILAALGTIYALGDEVDESDTGLIERIQSATWPDGRPVFTVPVAIGLMVFFAFCLQCGATMATMHRETGSWKWPVAAWLYMTALGYLGAWLVVTLGSTG